MKHCLCLLEKYLWCKFQQDRTIFMDAASPQKLLRIYNFRTTYAVKMKLTTIAYLHQTFHLTKDLGVTHREWQGVVKKPVKKAPKNRFFGSTSLNFQ